MVEREIDERLFERMVELGREITKAFRGFYLAGRTAITFKYRHSISAALGFFSYRGFSPIRLHKRLSEMFPVEKWEKGIDDASFLIAGIKVSFVFFPFKNVKRTEKVMGVRVASDYDLLLNKIYSAGRRIDPKDPYDFAFLFMSGKVVRDWDVLKSDFERKFPHQSFEIYMGAILNLEDYPTLPPDTVAVLLDIKEDFLRWRSLA